jgi:eukaryotic-like serine/threonine-protein kinase
MALTSGTKLGPYEVQAPLGAGGMGEVYRALDTRLSRTVAVKVLASTLPSSPELKQRMEREARAISSLNHPHICQLYDIGSHNGADFLVMEFLEGETLAERLRKGSMPLPEIYRIGIAIAEALAAAHARGIVHRDLKPGNIMVAEDQVKLLDFGLAKLSDLHDAPDAELTRQGAPETSEGSILGTVSYMSPEQAEARKVDARSDIFSFGAVLYEMATGQRAFLGRSKISTLAAILQSDPRPPAELHAGVPAELAKIILRCLRKDPAWRFQSAADLKISLFDLQRESDSLRYLGPPYWWWAWRLAPPEHGGWQDEWDGARRMWGRSSRSPLTRGWSTSRRCRRTEIKSRSHGKEIARRISIFTYGWWKEARLYG